MKYIPIYIQKDATVHSIFISGNCFTCIGWYLHPSSGEHTNVSTAFSINHTVTATCRKAETPFGYLTPSIFYEVAFFLIRRVCKGIEQRAECWSLEISPTNQGSFS
jgi:hypothetical protein